MSFQLRPYQLKFVEEIRPCLAKFQRILGVMATGAGKSKTFISISNQAISKGRTVLIITESTKIFKQLAKESAAIEIKAGSTLQHLRRNHIYVAMCQTLQRRQSLIDNFNYFGKELLVINDEAHIGTQTGLLKQLPHCYLLGVTATPDFRFAKHLPELYNAIVIGAQPDELVNEGYLSPYRHFARVSADLDQLSIKNGEFTEESQEKVFESARVYDGLINDLRTMPYNKCAIFCSSIKHCEHVTGTLTANGFQAVQVHSKLNEAQQSYNLGRFESGNINIICSVGSLTKGFDCPPIDLVVLNRATTSLPLYLQMIGRGSRIAPNKSHFTVLDYGGNFQRHGLWDQERDWAAMWNAKPKLKKGASPAPVKMCPKCEFILPAPLMKCTCCGHVFIKPETPQPDTQLIEVNELYNKMRGKKISQLTPEELAIYAKLKDKRSHTARVARAMEQKQPGYLRRYCAAMGYKAGWAHQQRPLYQEYIPFSDIVLK